MIRWDDPVFPTSPFHEVVRFYTNWSRPARSGIAAALRRRRLPDLDLATVADVARLTTIELRACHGVGPTTVDFVRGQIGRAGLTLADEAPGATIEDLPDEALIEMLPARRGPRGAQ
jgi:hypothetical protein